MEAQAGDPADSGGVRVLPARDLPKGTRLGKFEVQEMIGRGGMGAVYRAWDAQLRRNVAIKTLAPVDDAAAQSPLLRARFEREALAVGAVKHQNVVQIYDVGFADDGTPFIVMEHLEGKTLSEILKSRSDAMPVAEAIEIMLGVCAGVSACHRRGIIHRDLKPANVFLAKTDFQDAYEVKVLDFGVSKAAQEEELTHEGQIVGTPNYMSPEQARGKSESAIDARSDQYAIGVILYACVARRLPYQDLKHLELLEAISKGEFKPPREYRPEVSPGLEAIILRAMSVDPEARFPTVHELGRALLPFATERAQQKWTWMFSSVPHPSEATPVLPSPAGGAPSAPVAAAGSGAVESRPGTVDERGGQGRSTDVVSHTKTTEFAPGSEPPAVKEAPALAALAAPGGGVPASRTALTSTKAEVSSSAWNVGQEADSPGSITGHTGEQAPSAPVVGPAPATASRTSGLGRVLGAAGIAAVAVIATVAVMKGRGEEPLGVRNAPAAASMPVVPAVVPSASPAAVIDAGQVDGGDDAASAAAATPQVVDESAGRAADSGAAGERKHRERRKEAHKHKQPKVEVGTDGVPIPP